MTKLHIAPELSLPSDAVTQTFALLARRGAGKTHNASVLAEEMLAAGHVIVWLDPIGVAWGLRSKFKVAILGGEHGDVPLEPTGGKVVADFLVSQRVPAILDVSTFGENEMRRFVAEFAQRFYQTNREPVHWFVDEADEFCPQSGFTAESAKCLGAMQNVVRRGRARGIGVTLITQRSAVLNKSVLTQTECLIAMQTTAPQDLKAIDDWLKYHGTPEERETILRDLPTLQQGEAWVYSPGWLKILRRVKFRARHSFDSSRTPKPGEAKRAPKDLAEVDLSKLTSDLQATIERAKADDPKELRRRIAELERELRARPTAEPAKTVEVPVIQDGELDRVASMVDQLVGLSVTARDAANTLAGSIRKATDQAGRVPATPRPSSPPPARTPANPAVSGGLVSRPAKPSSPVDGLTGPQQAILDTVLMLDTRGIQAGRDTVARWLAIHPNGGSYGTNLGFLRSNGYLEGFRLTDLGRQAARAQETGLEPALAALPDEPKRKIVRTVVQHGQPLTRDELAEALGIHPNGGSYGTNLGWLRTMGIITERGPIAATEGLYR